MLQFKCHFIFFILIIGLLIKNSDCYCSTGCTYVYNSGTQNYDLKCTSITDITCTACDPLFYYPQPVNGTCVLANNIYNYT
jgi:hypothetical protein